MPATIFAHPMSNVAFDPPPPDPREQSVRVYPETAQSVVDAYLMNTVERAEAGYPPLPPPQLSDYERLDNHEAIQRLAERVGGWRRLATLVRNLAHLDGQVV